jgi:hypothetical protein
MAAVETEMEELIDIAVALARTDERILALTTRLNLMDKRWEELRERGEQRRGNVSSAP